MPGKRVSKNIIAEEELALKVKQEIIYNEPS